MPLRFGVGTSIIENREVHTMERIKTIATRDLTKSVQTGGCGECQTFPAAWQTRSARTAISNIDPA